MLKEPCRQGNYRCPRSCALEKDPRQAMLKKPMGRQGNFKRPRSCALKKAGASYVKKTYRQAGKF